jgi:DNA-binding LacI/PurR family transcriptional regulator
VDQALGARLATQHLLAAGHETVWHVSGPDDWFDSARRVDGWREALREAGVEEPPVIRADWTLAAGHAAGRMLANMPTVTAVFAANDHLAIGIMKALSEAGRRVPEDLSIVGFDDIPESAYLSPALTTIRPDFNAVAGEAVSMLMSQMAGGTDSPPLTVDAIAPTLVERDSVRVV